MRLTRADIVKLAQELESLPAVDDDQRAVNKTEAISLLAEQVRQLQERGYSYEMIARILTERGLAISAASLKTYLGRAKRATNRKPAMRKKRSKANTPASPASSHPATPAGEKSGDTEKTSVQQKSGFSVRKDSPVL